MADNQTITQELELAKKKGANLLMPTTSIHGLSEFMKPVVDSVYLSSKPDDGDVYPEKSAADTKFRITAQGLRKLAVAAGILWHPTACHRTDARNDRDYVSFQSVGGMKKSDGAVIFLKGEYDMDFEVLEEELKEIHRSKSKHWHKSDAEKQAYIDSSVRRDMLFKRKHKLKLCETGAATRVIRALLGLKSAYTKTELANPFIMVRIVFQPDLSDPETKRQVTAAAISAMTGVYGPVPPPRLPEPIDIPPEDYRTIPPDDPESETPEPAAEEAAPQAKKPTATTKKHESEAARLLTGIFADLPEAEQELELTEMSKEKGYDLAGLTLPLNEMDRHNRIRFFEHLSSLPKATKAVDDDDVPF